jgi:hypothetical protein
MPSQWRPAEQAWYRFDGTAERAGLQLPPRQGSDEESKLVRLVSRLPCFARPGDPFAQPPLAQLWRCGMQRRPQPYDREAAQQIAHIGLVAIIECGIGFLKECRSIATRYEKLALHYLGLVKVAMIERYLRRLSTLPTGGAT